LIDFKKVRAVAIFIFPDVDEFDFIGVYEVLGNANRMMEEGGLKLDEPLRVDVLATGSPISCRNGLKVVPHKVSSEFNSYDALIIPGGGGIRPLMKNASLLRELRQFANDHLICSVCTGSLLLGAAGVLEGKRALTHHWYLEELRTYAEPATGRVHVDSNVVTSAGISASIDLGLKLLELIYDASTARKVADRLELPPAYFE
jgi:transcriptional regulator GlxA family with amidase domain